MDQTKPEQDCAATDYVARKPESLVLGGYRNWISGIVSSDYRFWNEAWSIYAGALGTDNGRIALDAMSALVRQMRLCANCPLRYYRPDASHLCRDECLVLGMVAGAQHGDEDTLRVAAELLSCKTSCLQIIAPAGNLAAVLKSAGKILLPIPAAAIIEINARSEQGGQSQPVTYH